MRKKWSVVDVCNGEVYVTLSQHHTKRGANAALKEWDGGDEVLSGFDGDKDLFFRTEVRKAAK